MSFLEACAHAKHKNRKKQADLFSNLSHLLAHLDLQTKLLL